MTRPVAGIAGLAHLIEEVAGIVVPPGHFPFLAEVVARRARASGMHSADAYVAALARGSLPLEWRELLPLVTVKESYLFRTPQQLAVLESEVLPGLLRARPARRLSVWSAGCACGEEPATLAVLLAEHAALAGWDWRILATDVDETALATAAQGLFGPRAVAQVPPDLLSRHFSRRGQDLWELAPALRERIEYRYLNLVRQPFELAAVVDVVLLRNVLIYFNPASQQRVVAEVARCLAPDGALFLGPAETLWQLSEVLEPIDAGDCFYYRHRAAEPARPAPRPAPPPLVLPEPPPPRPVQRPATSPPPPAPPPAPTLAGSTRERLQRADARLVAGDADGAALLVEEALQTDPADPLAHALEGLLHEAGGRVQAAMASYRAALYLEPGLFQVRLLLADALRRLGWDGRAQQEYRQVLATLASGPARDLAELRAVPLPDRAQALRRATQALRG